MLAFSSSDQSLMLFAISGVLICGHDVLLLAHHSWLPPSCCFLDHCTASLMLVVHIFLYTQFISSIFLLGH